MAVITFILIYILVGIIFTTIFAWDEIRDTFKRCEPDSTNPLNEGEWQEFTSLVLTCLFGWGVLFVMTIVSSVKSIWKK